MKLLPLIQLAIKALDYLDSDALQYAIIERVKRKNIKFDEKKDLREIKQDIKEARKAKKLERIRNKK